MSLNQLDRVPIRRALISVYDKTGLAGNFDFQLNYQSDGKDEGLPTLFTALQEQLGLKLDSAKAAVDVLVIEHVERVPSGN